MGNEYAINIDAHPNIYDNYSPRKFNVYFSTPQNGVNEETGLVLLIPGFGANSKSKVYKKMRKIFADEYNLVTIQCDYFGNEFMQEASSIEGDFSKENLKRIFSEDEVGTIYQDNQFHFNDFLDAASDNNLNVEVKASLKESLNNFNDMGLMQAIDNINAVLAVIAILQGNSYEFNTKKIIAYGHSHGAYLTYLCNALNPNLFKLIIDNSAWLYPSYLKGSRHLYYQHKQTQLDIEFDYFASKLTTDEEILNLKSLYNKFENRCNIISFHGVTDNLISSWEKRKFCEKIKHCSLNEIDMEDIDGSVFMSTDHGLNADFLQLFNYVIEQHQFPFSKSATVEYNKSITLETKQHTYHLDYDTGLTYLRLE